MGRYHRVLGFVYLNASTCLSAHTIAAKHEEQLGKNPQQTLSSVFNHACLGASYCWPTYPVIVVSASNLTVASCTKSLCYSFPTPF